MNLDEVRASTATVLTVAQTTRLFTDLNGETVDERTVRRACEDGQLPSIRIGRRVLIPRLRLLAMLEVDGGQAAFRSVS
jgi:excisionase family DNA binding protein